MKPTFVLLFAIVLLGCSKGGSKKVEEFQEIKKDTPAPAAASELPNLQFTLADGSQLTATQAFKNKTVLVLFQPDCDHCQREASEIEKRMSSFKEYDMFFISSAPIAEVLQFAADYKLKNYPNIRWGTTTVPQILSAFGSISAPSIFIYTSDGKLKQTFNGEVAVESIIASL